ncbi:hypothetical protein H5410_008022, partial [Solanum commersonii]
AWRNWREGTTSNLIDPMLRRSSGLVSDITRCIHIALLCVQENCLQSLDIICKLISLNISPIQRYKSRLISESTRPAKSKSICLLQNEMSISELDPR